MTQEKYGRRLVRRITSGLTTAGLVLVAVPALGDRDTAPVGPAAGSVAGTLTTVTPDLVPVVHKKPHPNRKIKKYRVRPGDTPSGIAVRYHAWTAQLIKMNHSSTLYVGQVIRIPVVIDAAHECERHKHHRTGFKASKKKHAKPVSKKPGKKPGKKADKKPGKHPHKHKTKKKKSSAWTGSDASRAHVRKVIIAKAERHDVNPSLALAIAWQESGWQQRRVSSAGALGVMQVMPGTGQWMSMLVGRRLHLRQLHDNITAGVVLIKTLRAQAKLKTAIAGYYQGLAGVRRHGMYPSTKQYTANVLYLKKQIAHGWNPA